ncbi:MAG: class I SAM-dependent methyltransferase [Terrimicrobiaceae bacterium]
MSNQYNNKTFWENAHHSKLEDDSTISVAIREVGGEDSPLGAQALYILRRLGLSRLLKKVNLTNAPSIFEVGSGGGYWSGYFQTRFTLGRFTGSDISPTAVERLKGLYPKYQFHCLLENNAWKDIEQAGPYDLCLAIDVLYHITDDQQWDFVLRQLLGQVGDGGYAVISDYFFAEAREHPNHLHVKHRHLQAYLDIFELCGFSVIEIQPIFYLLNRVKTGPFRDHNRILSAILRRLSSFRIGLFILVGVDRLICKYLRPMNPSCRNRMLLVKREVKK